MRIAVLSDTHGNPLALDAVLADIEDGAQIEEYWLLGDYAALGADPIPVLERLAALPNATFVRGNTDRYLVTGEGPYPRQQDVDADPSLKPRYDEVQANFEWTRSRLRGTGWLDWLKALPLERRITLPDGTTALLVHASPGTDDGDGLNPGQSEDERRALVAGADVDLILAGHTHWAGRLSAGGVDIVAPGSVSNPIPPDLRAAYVTLDATPDGYEVEHHRVPYDLKASIVASDISGNPSSSWVSDYFRGEHLPGWLT